ILLPTPKTNLYPYTTLFRSRTLNFKVQTNDILYFDVDNKISYYKEGQFITVEKPDLTSLPSNAILVKEKDIPNKSYVYTNFNERSEEHTSELQSRENLVCRL